MFYHNKLSSRRLRQEDRRGTVIVLTALFSVILLGLVAFSVDIGYMLSVKEELQRTADSVALAACTDYGKNIAYGQDPTTSGLSARTTAQTYATSNLVSNRGPLLDLNTCNSLDGDLVFGYVSDVYNPSSPFDTTSPSLFNAVKVRVRRDSVLNGNIPLFFAKIFGHQGQPLYADATAAMVRNIRGFRIPNEGVNVGILPITLDEETWLEWMGGAGDDNYTWDDESGEVRSGRDGWLEVNLYPEETGVPGNRGTVDIGETNNSTNDIVRQIVDGVSPADLEHHGGSLELDSNGELTLNGDTGISVGVKEELVSIKGQPRTIPIFREVINPGDNATYTIVGWTGIRIMDVRLTGSPTNKHVTIQVAPTVGPGVIPSDTTSTSKHVYSTAVLIE